MFSVFFLSRSKNPPLSKEPVYLMTDVSRRDISNDTTFDVARAVFFEEIEFEKRCLVARGGVFALCTTVVGRTVLTLVKVLLTNGAVILQFSSRRGVCVLFVKHACAFYCLSMCMSCLASTCALRQRE